MSSGKNYQRFERPCLQLRGQAVQDLYDPRTIHQSTRQTPKNYICGTRSVSNSNLFYDLLVSIFVTPTILVSSHTTTQLPLKTHAPVVHLSLSCNSFAHPAAQGLVIRSNTGL
jgi:hypothetical protein